MARAIMKRELIAEDLRRRILSNELARGTPLRQDELARQLSSSITPVREALRILESEGMVVSQPHKGVRVAGLDLERTTATYIVRRLVESYAMRRATLRLTPLDIHEAGNLVEEMRRSVEVVDTVRYRGLNRDFHFLFYDRCGIPALRDQITSMWRAFPWDLSLDRVERDGESLQEHREIMRSIESGDLDEVAKATERHLERGFRSVLSRSTRDHLQDPFDLHVD